MQQKNKLEIKWYGDVYDHLKRDNEEVNSEKWLKLRKGEKINPKCWIVEARAFPDENGELNITGFRVPNCLYYHQALGKYTDETLDKLRERLVEEFPNLVKDVVFTEDWTPYKYLSVDSREEIEYRFMCY